MKIKSVRASRLRNEEHAQFQTEFKDLVEEFTPEILNVDAAFAAYLPMYTNEQTALNIVLKSSLTDAITNADHKRDVTTGGLRYAVDTALHHYDSAVVEAAQKVKIVLKNYGAIAEKSYNAETAAITKLISELNTNYSNEVSLLNISGWLNELQTNNEDFENLMDERYSEEAGKTPLRMSSVRKQVDSAYHTIEERINALIVINGEDAYSEFVTELNLRIDKYNQLIAQREGRND